MHFFQKSNRSHLILLLGWIVLGAALRLANLTGKALWTDEFATLVFSLGHSFQTIPINQVIPAETLLQPLILDPGFQPGAVVDKLLTESNHPPLYFLLTHFWLHLFPTSDGLVSLWGARSLAVLFGVAAVPAIFGLAYLVFQSVWISHLSAVLMATSPLGIYLAQEARHYTLPILWVIASLAFLVMATRTLVNRQPLPLWIVPLWILINGFGIATHYFFSFTLCAEGIVLLGIAGQQLWRRDPLPLQSTWLRLGIVAVGTLASLVVWLPFLEGVQDSEITQWIHRSDRIGLEWLDPVFQLLAGMITMLYMLPIQAEADPIRVASYVALVFMALWTGYRIYQGLQASNHHQAVGLMSGFVGGAIATFLIITYGFEREVTSAPRYHFVFFPAVLMLTAAALVALWERNAQNSRPRLISQTAVIIVCLSLLGSISVVSNLGYQKVHRPEVVAKAIREHSTQQTLIAILHRTHGQTGRLMGLAWDFKDRSPPGPAPLFLMAHATDTPESALPPLEQALTQLSTPFDLWLLEFKVIPRDRLQTTLITHHCQPIPQFKSAIDGYRYQLHTCDDAAASQ